MTTIKYIFVVVVLSIASATVAYDILHKKEILERSSLKAKRSILDENSSAQLLEDWEENAEFDTLENTGALSTRISKRDANPRFVRAFQSRPLNAFAILVAQNASNLANESVVFIHTEKEKLFNCTWATWLTRVEDMFKIVFELYKCDQEELTAIATISMLNATQPKSREIYNKVSFMPVDYQVKLPWTMDFISAKNFTELVLNGLKQFKLQAVLEIY